MNEYFRKWCCIIVVDHISVHGKLDSSLDDETISKLNNFVEKLNCNCHIYSERSAASEQLTFFELSDSESSLIEYAFQQAFEKGFRKVILLDARCDVSPAIIEEAFSCLKMIELCLGPKETGCYLFGMNFFDKDFFKQVPAVFLADKKLLIKKAGEMRLAIYKTPLLKDIPERAIS